MTGMLPPGVRGTNYLRRIDIPTSDTSSTRWRSSTNSDRRGLYSSHFAEEVKGIDPISNLPNMAGSAGRGGARMMDDDLKTYLPNDV
jgi:hypothetical protein